MRAAGQTDIGHTTRGACPSVHRPFSEVDGALVRVRVPGGILARGQLLQVAREGRRGTSLEITSRANLQIRGVPAGSVGELTTALVAAGVTAADPDVDARRNVLASPSAGHDGAELFDCRPLVAQVERLLMGASDALSPKFGVVVDGGGAVHVRGRRHDICLGAVRDAAGHTGLEVRLGAELPGSDRQAPALVLRVEDAAQFVQAALATIASHPAASGRAAGLVDALGEARAIETVAVAAGVALRVVDAGSLAIGAVPSVRPLGILRSREAGTAMVGAMPVLGRIGADTLESVAHLAEQWGDGQVRLTPWRSLLLVGVTDADAVAVRDALDRLGLVCDPTDPAASVVACAGSAGCPAGRVDTQRDGRRLVELLRAAARPSPASVHLSGCEKRCAAAGGQQEFALTLQGEVGEGDEKYLLFGRQEGTQATAPGVVAPRGPSGPLCGGLGPVDALALAASVLSQTGVGAA